MSGFDAEAFLIRNTLNIHRNGKRKRRVYIEGNAADTFWKQYRKYKRNARGGFSR